MIRSLAALLCAVAAIAVSGAAVAGSLPLAPDEAPAAPSPWNAPEPWRTDRFYLGTSVYTKHFFHDPAHNDHQELIRGEWNITEQWLAGAAIFRNSFGQPTQLVYGGYRFRPFESVQPLYLKVTAGLVHGYTGEYQNKVPYNNVGVAPVILPAVGYCLNRFCAEFVLFGAAGALVTFGVTIP